MEGAWYELSTKLVSNGLERERESSFKLIVEGKGRGRKDS